MELYRNKRSSRRQDRKFKYVKFTMDERDGGISAQHDFPLRLTDEEVGPVAV